MFPENLPKVILKRMPDAGFAAVLDAQGKVDEGVKIFAKTLPQTLAKTTVVISSRIHFGYAMLTV